MNRININEDIEKFFDDLDQYYTADLTIRNMDDEDWDMYSSIKNWENKIIQEKRADKINKILK